VYNTIMPKKRVSKPKEKKPELTHDQLVEALMFTEDQLERAAVPFVVMGEISRQIYQENDPKLKADKIELGVMAKNLAQSCKNTLGMLIPDATFADNKIYFVHNDVPVHIHKLENDNKYANNPDTKFFFVTQFRLPNPFDEFWKEYGI